MARYKDYSYAQTKMVAISYDRQIVPGTFEHTLSDVIDSMDMSVFEGRYRNDDTGAPAYDPRILLKVVLYAYSKGVIYSRQIARLCCENVVFMALSAGSQPHFTTIAHFVSSMQEEIVGIFRHVVQICMELELIDSIDGVNAGASHGRSFNGFGTRTTCHRYGDCAIRGSRGRSCPTCVENTYDRRLCGAKKVSRQASVTRSLVSRYFHSGHAGMVRPVLTTGLWRGLRVTVGPKLTKQ